MKEAQRLARQRVKEHKEKEEKSKMEASSLGINISVHQGSSGISEPEGISPIKRVKMIMDESEEVSGDTPIPSRKEVEETKAFSVEPVLMKSEEKSGEKETAEKSDPTPERESEGELTNRYQMPVD